MPDNDGNGWDEYKRLVIYRLDTIDRRLYNIEAGLVGARVKIAGVSAGLAIIISIILGVIL